MQVRHPPDNTHWPSILQLAFSLVATTGCWGLAALVAFSGLTALLQRSPLSVETASPFLLASGLLLSGFLLLPSAGYAFLRVTGRQAPSLPFLQLASWRPGLLILLVPPVLLAGSWLISHSSLVWLLLPPLHLLAVGLPVLWLVHLARRGLPGGSPQRTWGVFGASLTLGPFLILAVEILAGIFILVAVVIYISSQPQLQLELSRLAERISNSSTDPQAIERIFRPYLFRPKVIATGLFFGALLVPLVEEAIKPIGVWLLAGRRLEPAAGFVAGALSGAGYALFENLAFSSSLADWAFLVVGRSGAALMHIGTASLTGWALASAWSERRYLRLGAAYLLAVIIHGSWNALAILSATAALSPSPSGMMALLKSIGQGSPLALGLLAAGLLAFLLLANRRLKLDSSRI